MAEYRRAVVWVAVAATATLALGACSSKSDERDVAEAIFDQATRATTTTAATTPAKETEVDLNLPREATYAGATWKVTKVSFRSAGLDGEGRRQRPAAIVAFQVVNAGDAPKDLDVGPELVSLLDADGAQVPADGPGLDESGLEGTTVVAGGRAELAATFTVGEDVAADDLGDYAFQVGDERSEPAIVPLGGEMEASPYPLKLTMPASVDGFVLAEHTPINRGGAATLRSITATVTLDHDGEQAEKDTRFVTVAGTIDVKEGTHAFIGQSDLQLAIDGIAVTQVDQVTPPGTTDLPAGSTAKATWTFTVPDTGKSGTLKFGDLTEPGAKGAAFSLPELP